MDRERLIRFSEDALYRLLDNLFEAGKENTDEYKVIDAELDRRAEIENKRKETIRQRKEKEKAEREELKKRFDELMEDNKRCAMHAMAVEFGDDFGLWDDYHIDNDYTMTSLCDVKDEDKKQVCHESREDAEKTVRTRVYYRVYERLFRDGPSAETLDRLMTRILKMKSKDN